MFKITQQFKVVAAREEKACQLHSAAQRSRPVDNLLIRWVDFSLQTHLKKLTCL
jgi:hypothetical protein